MAIPELPRRNLLLAGVASVAGVAALAAGCASQTGSTRSTGPSIGPVADHDPVSPAPSAGTADPAAEASRATVPVLCYHQIRAWAGGDSSYNKNSLICPPDNFRRQLDGIKDAGFTTITPDAYLAHLRTNAPLPDKPVMLSFDDGKDSQPNVAAPELTKRGMTGTFFIMSVVIDKPGWITSKQVADLAAAGHTVGSHTYDHHDVRKYAGKDWEEQFVKPRDVLRKLSGQPVETFAYPYGAWNAAAFPHLAQAGYTTAYQLGDKPVDAANPLFTLRRILVNSRLDGAGIVAELTKKP